MLSTLFALCLLLGAPALAGALPPTLSQVVASAAQEGLPTSALQEKAQEGIAKGVPEARILAALTLRAASLRRAAALLPVATPDRQDLLQGAALALEHGASDAKVLQVATLQQGFRARGLESLADLLSAGLTEAEASALVLQAGQAPQPERTLAELMTATTTLVHQGMSPPAAAVTVSAELHAGRSPLGVLQPGSRGNGPPAHAQGRPAYGAPSGNNGNGNGGS